MPNQNPRTRTIRALHAGSLAATAAALYAAYRYGRSASSRRKNVFVLAVSLSFKDAAQRDLWIEKWLPMVEQVRRNEPGTISYELCKGDADPLKCLVYERYVDKQAYEGAHRSSEAMAEFKKQTAAVKVTVTGTSYYESNLGFM